MKILILIGVIATIAAVYFFVSHNYSRKTDVPWAPFLTSDEAQNFTSDVKSYFLKLGPKYIVDFDQGVVTNDSMSYGLENIAQLYHQASEAERKTIVKDFFNSLRNDEKLGKQIQDNINNFDSVKSYLGVRIYPREYLDQIGDSNLVTRLDFSGSVSVLVLDLPTTVSSIKPEQIAKWNLQTDELFRIGIDNVTTKYQPEISLEKITDKVSIWLISSENIFTTTHIFHLQNRTQFIGKYGSLVLIPHRHAVIIYPIDNLNVVEAIKILIPLGQKMYSEGPGSISASIMWYYDGSFINLPYSISNQKLNFNPPQEFNDALNQIK